MSWIEWNYPLKPEQIEILKNNRVWPLSPLAGIPYLQQNGIDVMPVFPAGTKKSIKRYVADTLRIYENGTVIYNNKKVKPGTILIRNNYTAKYVTPIEYYHYFWDNSSFKKWGTAFGEFNDNFVTGGMLITALTNQFKEETSLFNKLSEIGFEGIVRRSTEDNIPGPIYDVIKF